LGHTVPMVLDARVCGRVRTLPKLSNRKAQPSGWAFLLLGCGLWVVGYGVWVADGDAWRMIAGWRSRQAGRSWDKIRLWLRWCGAWGGLRA